MVYKSIRAAGKKAGVDNLGTHTMRKTFGYHYYKQYGDIETIRQIFNHSTSKMTTHYIGIIQDHINSAMREFEYRNFFKALFFTMSERKISVLI